MIYVITMYMLINVCVGCFRLSV